MRTRDLARRQWVRRHFRPLMGLCRKKITPEYRRLGAIARRRINPALVELVTALPDEDWQRIRVGRPAIYVCMLLPDGLRDPGNAEVTGPYGRTYHITIGWLPLELGYFDGDLTAAVGMLAHEMGHAIAGHQCTIDADEYSDTEQFRMQLEADAYAAKWGFARGLISWLEDRLLETRDNMRLHPEEAEWHRESIRQCRARIKAFEVAAREMEARHSR